MNVCKSQEINDLAFTAASNQAYDQAISAKAFNFGATATGTPYGISVISYGLFLMTLNVSNI